MLHLVAMAKAIHVRLDDEAAEALSIVRSQGLTESEAVRVALRETAQRRRRRSTVAQEVRALAADAIDRAEMAEVRALMADLAPRET